MRLSSPNADSSRRRQVSGRFVGWAKSVNKIVYAVLALAVMGLTLYTQWPRSSDEESIALSTSVKPGLTFAQFVQENCLPGQQCGDFTPAMGRMPVVAVSVEVVNITGYKGKTLQVVLHTGNATSGGIVSDPQAGRQFHATLASDQQDLEPFWLYLPSEQGRYFVQVTLLDPATTRKVTTACTPVFTVSRSAPGEPLRGSGGQGKAYQC